MLKFKCELLPGSYFTAADMLNMLSQQQLVAAALENTIVLAAEPALAWLLDRCCIGRLISGTVDSSTCESSGSSSCSVAALVVATAGVNTASEEWQQQYGQYLMHMQSRKRRKARRTPGHWASAHAGMTMATVASIASCNTEQPQTAAEAPVPVHDAPEAVQAMTAENEPAIGSMAAAESNACSQQPSGMLCGGLGHVAGPTGGSTSNECVTENGSTPAADLERTAAMAGDGAAASGAALDPVQVDPEGAHEHGSSDWMMPLQLVQVSCQEAFFLVHVMMCCSVFLAQHPAGHHAHVSKGLAQQQHWQEQEQVQSCQQQTQWKQPLTVPELWQWCCRNAPGGADVFVPRYAAYTHFRSKGWLPLPGLLYGADYVLYKLHPEQAHSDFVVTVIVEQPESGIQTDTLPAEGVRGQGVAAHKQGISVSLQDGYVDMAGGSRGHGSSRLTWLDAHIMQRLARQVLKQFLLLYVVIPSGLKLQTVDCMQHIKVREVLLQRWVPSQHREDGKE